MRRIMVYILVALLVVVFSIILVSLLNPLRKSNERLKADMLKLTPIGMSMEDVIAAIENNDKWEIRHIVDGGYTVHDGMPLMPYHGGNNRLGIRVGVKSMEVDIGSYNFLVFVLKESVSIFYGFDEESKLVDIAVRRYVHDAL